MSSATSVAEPPSTAVYLSWNYPLSDGAVGAVMRQQMLPELTARAEVARAKSEARSAYFLGEADFLVAFSHLGGAVLSDRVVLRGRLQLLDDVGAKRAAARVASVPGGLSEQDGALLREAVASAVKAEAIADEQERALLLGLRAHIDQHPALSEESLAPLREVLKAQATAVRARLADEPELARELAVLDEEQRRLQEVVSNLWTVATVPGAQAPSARFELQQLDQRGRGAAALARLNLLLPFLNESEQAGAQKTAASWLRAVQIPALQTQLATPVVVPALSLDELATRRVDVAVEWEHANQAVLDASQTNDELSQAMGQVLALQLDIIGAERDALSARVAAGERAIATAGQEVYAAETAQLAREKLDAVRQLAADALDQTLTEHKLSAIDREVVATERLEVVVSGIKKTAADWKSQLDLVSEKASLKWVNPDAALGESVHEDPDITYDTLRGYVATLTEEALDAHATRRGQRNANDVLRSVVTMERGEIRRSKLGLSDEVLVRAEQEDSLKTWATALDGETKALDAVDEAFQQQADRAVLRRRRAVAIRRSMRSQVSRAQLANDAILAELGSELQLIAPRGLTFLRERTKYVSNLPGTAGYLAFFWGLLTGSFRAFVLVGLWVWARRTLPVGVTPALVLLRARFPDLRPADLVGIKRDGVLGARALLDLTVGLLLLPTLFAALPEFALPLYLYMYVAAWRLLMATFDLLIVPSARARTALRVMSDDGFAVARFTLNILAVWWLARRAVLVTSLDIIGADAIHDIFALAFFLGMLGVLGNLLHRWEPILRRSMSRLHQSNSFVVTLTNGPPQPALQAVWAVGSGGFIAAQTARSVVLTQASQNEWLGRLINVFTRYQFSRVEEEATNEDIPVELADVIIAERCVPKAYIPRPECDAALVANLAIWQKEQRRGLIALVGDRGDGKRTWLDAQMGPLQKSGYLVTRISMTGRITVEQDLFDWLSDSLGIPKLKQTTEVVAALRELPAGVIIIEEAQYCFLRAVEGFDAVRKLMYLLNSASSKHFWIVSMHRPAWLYLERLGSLVDVGVFRDAIRLKPMGESETRALCLSRVVDKKVDFERLVRSGPLGGDPEIELERTTTMYFRVLAEASMGNPAVALRMFVECLSPREDGALAVHMAPSLQAGTLRGLTEQDLFTLVALRTQDLLDEEELVHVTNMAPGQVRSVVQLLQGKGLVDRYGEQLRIVEAQLPAVTRTLLRRHFLQWAV